MLKKALFVTIFVIFATGAFTMARLMSATEPQVVLLHTQKEIFPDFAFRISSVPLAFATFVYFGKPAFALWPATHERIKKAFANSSFVVVGTHGSEGQIKADDPPMIGPDGPENLNMRLVYFGTCEFGLKRELWQQRFPRAKLIGYDGLTTPLDGWIYLVFRAWVDLKSVSRE